MTTLYRLLLLGFGSLSFGLSGCSPTDPSASSGGSGADSPLRVGMDLSYPPFESRAPDGSPTGVSVRMAGALAQHLDRELQIVSMSFDGLIPALKTGDIDLVISSMTANEKRRQSIDFSDPYVRTGLAILTPTNSSISSLDDLKKPGTKLIVRLGTTGEMYAKKHLPDAKVTVLDQDAACVMEIVNGSGDAYIYDQLSIFRYHQKHSEKTRALLNPIQEEFWAIGLAKGNDTLRSSVNDFLEAYRASGAFDQLADEFLSKEKTMLQEMGVPFIFVEEEEP